MKGKLRLLMNYKEVNDYDSAITEYGITEAINLGKVTGNAPEPVYSWEDYLFRKEQVSMVYKVFDKEADQHLINLKMEDGELWSICFEEKIWKQLEEYFKDK